ncbi:hypothetical protein CQ12_04795 [Bradyrhizobium jicamae]|uniref:Uncharacterized protein n=1 Tax=Bradyrhizobium jicamae TaxID=280332 RepID=A0A0R3KNH7_9BRAD|nr:hypothetical protein CQ12_04795 [Bradyrhizobium jicamae]
MRVWTNRKKNAVVKGSFESWLIGFISGLNINGERDMVGGGDLDAIITWMDRRCLAPQTGKQAALDPGPPPTACWRALHSRSPTIAAVLRRRLPTRSLRFLGRFPLCRGSSRGHVTSPVGRQITPLQGENHDGFGQILMSGNGPLSDTSLIQARRTD